MSIYMNVTDYNFRIPVDRIEPACAEMRNFASKCKLPAHREKIVDKLPNESFEDIMSLFDYEFIPLSDSSFVISCNKKLGYDDDKLIFDTLAPYVENGSYIIFADDCGSMWRYLFRDGECVEQYPEIEWVE